FMINPFMNGIFETEAKPCALKFSEGSTGIFYSGYFTGFCLRICSDLPAFYQFFELADPFPDRLRNLLLECCLFFPFEPAKEENCQYLGDREKVDQPVVPLFL